MTLIALIQARMDSRRLPGKVLMPLGKKLVLEHVVDRVSRIEGIDRLLLQLQLRKQTIQFKLGAREIKSTALEEV